MGRHKVYFNKGQLYLMAIGANTETIIASRRFGKSDGIIAPRMLRNVQHMPRSAGGIYGATFQQILTRTLPAAVFALNRWGYKHEVHYYIGRKAPDRAKFQKPYIEPQSWDHCIHWYNGSVQLLISQDVKFSANSLTLDYILGDEARSFKKDKFFNEVVPANSGVFGKFDDCPWHRGITLVSDMPQGKDEEWLLKRKEEMDTDLISAIEGIIARIAELKNLNSEYGTNEIVRQKKELAQLRRVASIYKEYDAIENIEILGESYIANMKRELTPLTFLTSILNKRLDRKIGGFYANLSAAKHYYDSFDNSFLDNLRDPFGTFDLKRFRKLNCRQDGDIDKDIPLHIACDYNANINWMVIGQPTGSELRTLKSIFVKHQEKLRKLIENFCNYYEPLENKDLVYFFDSTALDKAYADEASESFSEIVINELSKRGWNVYQQYIGNPMKHALKHQYIDDGLCGKKYLFPRFNRFNNESLLPAMENTGIKVGRNGFEKDKSGEKLAETDQNVLESRTDGTDAWDTLFIGCNFFPVNYKSRVSMANIYSK